MADVIVFFFFRMVGMALVMRLSELFQSGTMRKYNLISFERYILNPRAVVSNFVINDSAQEKMVHLYLFSDYVMCHYSHSIQYFLIYSCNHFGEHY